MSKGIAHGAISADFIDRIVAAPKKELKVGVRCSHIVILAGGTEANPGENRLSSTILSSINARRNSSA
jgi:hypothetical protein